MSVCTRCGHELDPASVGRFCTNCGQPIGVPADDDWRSTTAERPAVARPDQSGQPDDTAAVPVVPAAPPSPHTAPLEPPRFPLYADELGGTPEPAGSAPPPPILPPIPSPEELAPEPDADPSRRRRAPWWPWLVAAAVLVLVAVLGYRLLLSPGDGTRPTAEETTQSQQGPDKKPTKEPSKEPTKKPDKPKPGKPGDVASSAEVEVPATAPPNQDVNGNTVTYEAANMVDGKPDTCWRMPGDGTGSTITFTLPQETEVTEVGMINGYAKTAGDLDWYAGNRRIVKATWEFDDGTVIEQDLAETRDMQTLQLDPVTTTTVRLTLTEVSKPGSGPEARNYTAISEVTLVGKPQ